MSGTQPLAPTPRPPFGPALLSLYRADLVQDAMTDPVDPDALRAAWEATNQAALEILTTDLAAAASPEDVYAAHARFLRATATGFSQQMTDLAALLRRLAGLD